MLRQDLTRWIAIRLWPVLFGLAVSCAGLAQPNVGKDITKYLEFKQKLGNPLPLDAKFTNDKGEEIVLGDLFGERPVLLMPVFYTCKSSCLLVRDGVIKSLNAQKALKAGRDFDVVAFSIHPNETPELARAKKAQWVSDYKYPESGDGWHLLTGPPESVKRITEAIGFKYYYDATSDTVAHPAGIVLITRDGRTSEYILGVNYPQKWVYDGLLRAGRNEIGQPTQEILFGCLVYDPSTGRYRAVVERVLQVAGTSFALVAAIGIYFLAVRNRRAPLTRADFDRPAPKDNGTETPC
jgi:protein SCO1/2